MTTYYEYSHKKLNLRLVLEDGKDFPPGTSPEKWIKLGERKQLNEREREEMAAQGFSLGKIVAQFTEALGIEDPK